MKHLGNDGKSSTPGLGNTTPPPPPPSVKVNIVMCYAWLTANYLSNNGRLSTQRFGTPPPQPPHSVKLNTVMCYVQLTTKHLSNDRRSFALGLGKPPHLVKLNIVMCYMQLTAKHLSKYKRSLTPCEMCNVYAMECFRVGFKDWSLMRVTQGMSLQVHFSSTY